MSDKLPSGADISLDSQATFQVILATVSVTEVLEFKFGLQRCNNTLSSVIFL